MDREHQGAVPFYQQVANILRASIISIEEDTPVRLPTERELCRIHRISRETIREALHVLEEDGLIERARRRGTLTVPAGVRAWRRLRHARVIKLVTTAIPEQSIPTTFYGRVNQGIFQRSEQAGYSISTLQEWVQFPGVEQHNVPEDPTKVLGVIICGLPDERIVAMHAQAGYPVVVVDYWSRDPRVDAVVVDCFGEGERAAEFLLEQGHRNIFYLGNRHGPSGGDEHEADADLMLTGFQRALRRAGVELPDDRVLFCRYYREEVQEAVKRVARMRPRPTAGLIFSSVTTQEFLGCLAEWGLRCPEDISLISKAFAGEPLEAATLRADPDAMGRLAVDLLLDRVSGKREEPVCVAIRSPVQRGPTVRQLTPR